MIPDAALTQPLRTTPVRALKARAHAEGWVGTVHRESLDRILILGRRHYRSNDKRETTEPQLKNDPPPGYGFYAEAVGGSRKPVLLVVSHDRLEPLDLVPSSTSTRSRSREFPALRTSQS